MLDNIRWRLGMWAHHLLNWRPRNYKGLNGGQDD